MPCQGRFIGIFFPHFYLKGFADSEVILRRLQPAGDERDFAKKARSRDAQACARRATL